MVNSTPSDRAARRLRPGGPFHLPPPAAPVNTTVELRVSDSSHQPEAILSDTRRDLTWRVALTRDGDDWTTTIRLPVLPTILRYHFQFSDGSTLRERRQEEGRTRPVFDQWRDQPFQLSVYDPDRMPPDWTRGMVIYQIFPDRFADGDPGTNTAAYGVYGHEPVFKAWGDPPEEPPLGRDFYGGDLRGVLDRIDYLAGLGIDLIYFTPIFAAPSNHRYDANDYLQIDPMLGTEADFDALVTAAREHDIRIILDAVYNHCSADSVYFTAARASNESPYYRWFTFTDYPHDWKGWFGFKHMPEFAECPEVEAFFMGEDGPTGYWTRKGAAGFRTDVTFDNSDEFWRRWRTRLDTYNPASYTVAEEWENASHYLLGDMFSATMNYRFAWAVRGFLAMDRLTPTEFDDRLMTWRRDTPEPAQHAQMNLLDSHDTGRAFVACGQDRDRFAQMIAFQFAYIGAPMIYYGDETGLTGDYAEAARQTMPWDALDADLIDHYKRLIALRHESPALRRGSVETVVIDDNARTYAFVRRHEGEAVYAIFNVSDQAATVRVPLADGDPTGAWYDLLGNHGDVTARDGALTVELGARGVAWLTARRPIQRRTARDMSP